MRRGDIDRIHVCIGDQRFRVSVPAARAVTLSEVGCLQHRAASQRSTRNRVSDTTAARFEFGHIAAANDAPADRIDHNFAAESRSRKRWACDVRRKIEPGQSSLIGPRNELNTASALRVSGTMASTRWADNNAGIVNVIACVGTSLIDLK
jgi:hypothetical protein